MDTWLWALLAILVTLSASVVVVRLLLRRLARPPKELLERIGRLSWRERLDFGLALVRDSRLPLSLRLVIPAVGLYLIMPLDIIPDFIPVIGALDDVLIVLVALRLILRSIPADVLDEHLRLVEDGHAPAVPDAPTLDR